MNTPSSYNPKVARTLDRSFRAQNLSLKKQKRGRRRGKTFLFVFQLFGSILESFRDDFKLSTSAHIVLFPYFLYPVNQVAISGSIFMTVAIAWVRKALMISLEFTIDHLLCIHRNVTWLFTTPWTTSKQIDGSDGLFTPWIFTL